MQREDMLEKLHKIKFSARPTVVTMDMGLEYEYASKDGWGNSLGNMGDWPAYKLAGLTLEQFSTIQKKILDHSLQIEDLENTPLSAFYNNVFSAWRPEKYIPTISDFFSDLGKLQLPPDGVIYVLCDAKEWTPHAQFFCSYEAMEKEFSDEYASYIEPWEDLDDEDLEEWVTKVDDELDGIPLYEYEA